MSDLDLAIPMLDELLEADRRAETRGDNTSQYIDYRDWTPATTKVITYDIGFADGDELRDPDARNEHSRLHGRRWAPNARQARDEIREEFARVCEENAVTGRMFFRVPR